MEEIDLILMSLVIFVPSLFAIGLLFFPKGKEEAMRWWSLAGTALTLGLSLCAFIRFKDETIDRNRSGGKVEEVQKARERMMLSTRVEDQEIGDAAKEPRKSDDWVSRHPWIEPFQIEYFLGTDGISMALVVMTTVISFFAMIASWGINKMVRGYCILFLLLETGMLGTFLALDFFLFF